MKDRLFGWMDIRYKVWLENNRYLKFVQKVFIYLSIYLSCPLQSNSLSYNTLIHLFFQSLKHFWNTLFGIANSSFQLSSIVTKRFPFIGIFSFVKKKNQRGPSPVIPTSFDVWAGALSCAKAMIVFSKILCVSDELLRAISA